MAVRRFLVAGRYRLHEPVGSGGMGRVWMARDEMLDRDVAVKEFVPPEWMTDGEKARLRDRTLREARSAARLNHPHVVRIYDVVHADDLPWIVMEYVPSRSLYQVINEDGPFPPAAAAQIGLDVLSALTAAHRAGVLHRDVKPHNVLIGTDGRVVLTDFGLATFVDDGSVTGPGLVVGSPQYVSPERARDGASTVESDLWSLGATLYAAVEGRSPYARDSAMASLMALATEEPDPPVLAGPLAPVLYGLLRHEPTDRLTGREVEDGLRAVTTPATARGRATAHRVVVPSPRRAADDAPAAPEKSAVATAMAPPSLRPASQSSGAPVGESEIAHASGPVSAPPAERRRRRSRPWPVLAGALIVVLLAGAAIFANWMVQRRDDADRRQALLVPASAGATTPASTGFTPVACQQPVGPRLPRTPQKGAATSSRGFKLLDSWHEYADRSGFRIGVPDGWTYERVGTTLCFRDPANVRFMSVDPDRDPAGDPVKACTNEAGRLVAAGDMRGYRQVGLERAAMQITAADWEYTWTGPKDRMHAKTRWFKSGSHAYAVSWATRDFDWQINTAYYGAALSTFTAIK
jgi:tRNA A-37 threonylcarbamoyl transferase component Bud32